MKPRAKVEIRQLRKGEALPASRPGLYRSGHGYMRLRWKVGTHKYVEAYEHRLALGLPDCHVHHKDEDKANNEPANLEPLTAAEHRRRHVGAQPWRDGYRVPSARRWMVWGGLKSAMAYEKHQRRLAREASRRQFSAELAEHYAAGLTTVQIAELVGIHESNVYLALRKQGVTIRTRWDYRPPIDRETVRRLHAEGARVAEMMRRLAVGRTSLHQIFDELGLPKFGPGNPRTAGPKS